MTGSFGSFSHQARVHRESVERLARLSKIRARGHSRRLSEQEPRIRQLEADVGRLSLLVLVLQEALVAKGIATPAELTDLAQQVEQAIETSEDDAAPQA